MKKLLSLGLILILITVFSGGCKKDKGDPPLLPPAESMTIDFSNFQLQKKGDVKGTENSAWEFSATVAGIWRLVINTTLIVPVASFQLAASQTPVYLSKNNWQWSYNATVAGSSYKARLTGEIRTSEVAWKMYITKEGTGAFAEFLWFEGTSKLDGSGGQWILNQSSSNPSALLQIDWTKSASAIGKITYTYVKNGDALYKGSTIEYGRTSGTLDAYYKVTNKGVTDSYIEVEWSTSLKNGRVKSTSYFLGDTNWHCWDANKVNISCPL
jgi:hypothetical protein